MGQQATLTQPPKLLYLSKSDVIELGGNSSTLYVESVRNALSLHARGKVAQPLKPYLRWRGKEGHIADRIIAMPAFVGGDKPIAGLKWIGSKHDNPAKGLERASAVIILNDPETHYPVAVIEGSLISGMRTAAVTAVAIQHLALPDARQLACIGCGPIARMQIETILEHIPSIQSVFLFDIRKEAMDTLINSLREKFPSVQYHATESAEITVKEGDIVVTCTVTDKPYIPYHWLRKGSFVCNVSIMDLEKEVFLKADKVVVDDWDQANREKKIINQLVEEGKFSREQLHAELGEIVVGKCPGRESEEEIIVLNPMGMAIEDIACAQSIYQKALQNNKGVWLSLN